MKNSEIKKKYPRAYKAMERGVEFMVVRCDEPYANDVAKMIKRQAIKDGTWTDDCKAWFNCQGLLLDSE